MHIKRNRQGFTLIEILLVVVIIGIMLAVIVPRAWRANVDSKYGLVRQAGSELASFATQWAEEQIVAQSESAGSTMNNYMQSLCGSTTAAAGAVGWVGYNGASNWHGSSYVAITNRGGTSAANPETSVEGVVPPEKHPRNPFNGASYFTTANDGSSSVIPGALALTYQTETAGGSTWNYYGLLFLGTDSASSADFHAGQDAGSLEGVRNGVFVARTR